MAIKGVMEGLPHDQAVACCDGLCDGGLLGLALPAAWSHRCFDHFDLKVSLLFCMVILWFMVVLNDNQGILRQMQNGGHQPGSGQLLRHPSDPHGVQQAVIGLWAVVINMVPWTTSR